MPRTRPACLNNFCFSPRFTWLLVSNTGTGKAASSASVAAEFLKGEIKDNHAREKERRDFAEKSASAARKDYLSLISKAFEQVGGQAQSKQAT